MSGRVWSALLPAEKADRERRKKLWLDPLLADLRTAAALQMAAQHHVSLRLAAQIAGFIVNLDSFLDAGYVYASQAGLAEYIKNENGRPTSDRQVRRGIAFLCARKHLRIENCRGKRNKMFPLYRAAAEPADPRLEGTDTMSSDQGPDVLKARKSCPPKLILKPITNNSPPAPPSEPSDKIVRLTDEMHCRQPEPIAFDAFYRACIKVTRDPEGPALANWNRLTIEDRCAIGELMQRDVRIDVGATYVCTWLKGRCWERKSPQLLAPYSARWHDERERRITAGLDVRFMDAQAREGKGWTVVGAS